MKISKKSWHYRFNNKVSGYKQDPQDLCGYVSRTALNILKVFIIVLIISAGILGCGAGPWTEILKLTGYTILTQPWHFFIPMYLCGILTAGILFAGMWYAIEALCWIINRGPYVVKHYINNRSTVKLLTTYFSDRKKKRCSLIEFVD